MKQVSLPNLTQVSSYEAQKKVDIPAAESAEVKPEVKEQEEKPAEKKPKKAKVEKKGKDKNAGTGGLISNLFASLNVNSHEKKTFHSSMNNKIQLLRYLLTWS